MRGATLARRVRRSELAHAVNGDDRTTHQDGGRPNSHRSDDAARDHYLSQSSRLPKNVKLLSHARVSPRLPRYIDNTDPRRPSSRVAQTGHTTSAACNPSDTAHLQRFVGSTSSALQGSDVTAVRLTLAPSPIVDGGDSRRLPSVRCSTKTTLQDSPDCPG